MILKRIFKTLLFLKNNYCNDVQEVDWSEVLLEKDLDLALVVFKHLLLPL